MLLYLVIYTETKDLNRIDEKYFVYFQGTIKRLSKQEE